MARLDTHFDTVVFDIDGTLLDSNYHHTLAWSRAFESADVSVPLWRIHRHIGMGGDRLVPAVAGEEVDREQGDDIRDRWEQELGEMRTRIHAMRAGLVERLKAHGALAFDFIQSQAGMFSYSGLSKAQVLRLREEHAIYALDSGRICVAALNRGNLDTVAAAVAAVSR